MIRRVQVVPYDPRWPSRFNLEAEELKTIFGQEVVAIHHIGSTAIVGILAKPIIDILVVVHDIRNTDGLNCIMQDRGYEPKGEFGIAGRRFFIKGGDTTRTHHIHVFQAGNPEIEKHRAFRDYLLAHPEEAAEYSQLKRELAMKFPEDSEAYCAGKEAFIKKIDDSANSPKEDDCRVVE